MVLRSKKLPLLALAAAAALVLAGCSTEDTASTATPNQIDVVAAFYPLEFLADRIGDDHVRLTEVTPSGADAHDIELSPRQVAAIQDADLVLYVEGFQPAIDVAVEQLAPAKALDLGAGLETRKTTDHEGKPTSDPHVWLNPLNMVTMADRVTERLIEIRPENQSDFETHQDRLETHLQSLDEKWEKGTKECESRDLVVSHEAFGYLADRYDFTQIGISGLSPEAEPSPTRIAEISEIAKRADVTTIYYETSVDPQIAQTVAEETGVETAVLDPLATLPPNATGDYLSVMLENLATIRDGQRCR